MRQSTTTSLSLAILLASGLFSASVYAAPQGIPSGVSQPSVEQPIDESNGSPNIPGTEYPTTIGDGDAPNPEVITEGESEGDIQVQPREWRRDPYTDEYALLEWQIGQVQTNAGDHVERRDPLTDEDALLEWQIAQGQSHPGDYVERRKVEEEEAAALFEIASKESSSGQVKRKVDEEDPAASHQIALQTPNTGNAVPLKREIEEEEINGALELAFKTPNTGNAVPVKRKIEEEEIEGAFETALSSANTGNAVHVKGRRHIGGVRPRLFQLPEGILDVIKKVTEQGRVATDDEKAAKKANDAIEGLVRRS